MVRKGMSARAVTSEIASVNDDANAPMTAVSSFWLIRRCATVGAVDGFEVASLTTRLILAPPSALMPPAALIASATSSIPLRHFMPHRALAADNGWITPILIVGLCAKPERMTNGATISAAAPPAIARRRVKGLAIAAVLRPDMVLLPFKYYYAALIRARPRRVRAVLTVRRGRSF